MKPEIILALGVDAFTLSDLFKKAAAHKGLSLGEGKTYSEPIKTYPLDERLLAVLAERKIKRHDRPDAVFTLVDENPQERIPGFESGNYWNFTPTEPRDGEPKFNLEISLCVKFGMSIERRGITLRPQAHGTFLSAADDLPNLRMFRALVENDETAPPIAEELAASDGDIAVTWTDLDLGGIRKLPVLFAEFARNSDTIRGLKFFTPNSHDDHLFIAEPAQSRIFQAWQKQLEEYRAKLFV